MLTITFYLVYLLHPLLSITATTTLPSYTPDIILLNCGATSNSTSSDGRNWDGDARSKFSLSNPQTTSFAAQASSQATSVTQVPYMTARIFSSKFTYTFPVSPGPKFVRLYFYPATYSNLDITKSFFSVKANNYTLMNNFSAFLTVSAMNPPVFSFIKEFIVTVLDNEFLNITFSPSPTSYAFINGIEVVSMPNNLYARGDTNQLTLVGSDSFYYLYNSTALETLYRLNVGGGVIRNVDDSGMYRTWLRDLDYIFGGAIGVDTAITDAKIEYTTVTPPYTAPTLVYSTSRTMGKDPDVNLNYNLTWFFSTDAGFFYLVRLHFCEVVCTLRNQRVFSIFINNQTADNAVDVINLSGGEGVPVIKDYIVWVPKESQDRQYLWLALHPNIKNTPQYVDAILNGLEIFKLNQSDGNLAGPNPEPVVSPTPDTNVLHRRKSKGSLQLFKVIMGTVLSGIVVVFLSCFFVFLGWKRLSLSHRQSSNSTQGGSSFLPKELCRRFAFVEIQAATKNFDDDLVVGDGGFGKVYKGYIDGGHVPVAVKRLKANSQQGAREFLTEIQMLSQLRYIHLVSLIGYCNDEREMILVYDYMANGTLRDHLYGRINNSPLPWKQRLNICIGGARGLDYLHTGTVHRIIHRDVKTTNILLDEKWVTKVSDFGLSKLSSISTSTDPISTEVKGTFGYMDPEYFWRKQVSEKTDVYSFGVVLLEVLCARPAVNLQLEEEKMSLANWARARIREEKLDEIMDPYLRGKIAPKCLRLFVEIAERCLDDHGIQRPSMSDVVASIECALQLQESVDDEEDVRVGSDLWSHCDDSDQEMPIIP